jgi:hypothetical protein
MCHINTESGLRDVDIGCDITFNTVKNNHSSVQYITSSSYDNVYSMSFDIIKSKCDRDRDDIYLTSEEVRRLITWLNRREYRKLKLINATNADMSINYYGSFNVKQIMMGDNIIGLSLTFTSNAPYGFADEISMVFTFFNKKCNDCGECGDFDEKCSICESTNLEYIRNEHFYLSGDGDEIGIIYPKVTITFKQDCENFSILNVTTGTTLFLKNCLKDETITIDGEHKIILTNTPEHNTLYNDFNYEYLDIQVADDDFSENMYEVSAPCLITIEYSPIRKVGVL